MSKLDDVIRKIDDIHRVVMGNGNPKKGLVYIVDRHETFISNIVWGLKVALVPVIGGGAGFLIWMIASYAKS